MSSNGTSPRPFKPSSSGALPARPRNRLSNTLIEDLTIAWERDGADCLRIMAKEEPSKFAQLAFATLPRNVMLEVGTTLPGSHSATRDIYDTLAPLCLLLGIGSIRRMSAAAVVAPITSGAAFGVR
jgi:hypothetical protein